MRGHIFLSTAHIHPRIRARAHAVGIYSSVFIDRPRRADGHVCFCVVVVRPRAAASWNCLAPNSPWQNRSGHATVIDRPGNIYLIGGSTGGTRFNDVWTSTNGGADRTRGVSEGTRGVLTGSKVCQGVLMGSLGVLLGYSVGTQLVLTGY